MTTRILDEGTCARCNTQCTREPGGKWNNFYGRTECRLDPDEGPHVVNDWHQIELPTVTPPLMAEVIMYGRDTDGKTVEVRRQFVPAVDGAGYIETLPDLLEVTGWSIKVSKSGQAS